MVVQHFGKKFGRSKFCDKIYSIKAAFETLIFNISRGGSMHPDPPLPSCQLDYIKPQCFSNVGFPFCQILDPLLDHILKYLLRLNLPQRKHELYNSRSCNSRPLTDIKVYASKF